MPESWRTDELTFLDEEPQPAPQESFATEELEFLDEPTAEPAPEQPAAPDEIEQLTGIPPGGPESGLADTPPEILRSRLRTLAEVGAGIGAGFVPGLQPIAGATLGPRLGLLAARVGMAGLAGGGASLAAESFDPTEGGIEAKVKRAAGTGARTAAGQLVGEGIGAAAKAAAPPLKKFAENQGAKALGLIQSGLRKVGIGRAREMARIALDEGVVTPLASAEKMLARATAVSDDAGAKLGNLRALLDQKGASVDALDLATKVEKELFDWKPGTTEEQVLKKHLEDTITDVLAFADKNGKISASALGELKGYLAGRIYSDPLLSPAALAGRIKPRTEVARGVVQGAEDDLFARLGSPEEAAQFGGAKRTYGAMERAKEALEQRIARDVGNNQVFGLSNQLGAILGGSALGGPAGGAGALTGALGTRFLHQRGNQLSSVAADRLAQVLQSDATDPATRAAVQSILATVYGGER